MNCFNFYKKIAKTFLLCFASIFLFSCEIGLGESVDIIAPSINIKSPKSLSSVTQEFIINGSVSDNIGIKKITVNIDEAGLKFVWNGAWKQEEDGVLVDFENGSFSGTKKNMDWSLRVRLENAVSAQQYTITSTVQDNYGNESVKSTDERSVTVDVVDPMVSLITPFKRTYAAAKEAHDGYQLKNNKDLTNLYNGNFMIKGSQKEDTRLGSLYLIIDKGTSYDPPSIEEYPNIMDYPDAIYKVKQTTSSRTWEIPFDITKLPEEYLTGKHLFRIITESFDEAGNKERKVNTWFTFWNDADKPWVVCQFGDEEDKASDYSIVYPSCNLQGQAYDDDGLKSVEVKTVIKNNGVWDEANATTTIYNLESKNYPTYFNFSVTAIAENKKFKIITKCVDKNGIESEEVVRYMGIADVNPPSLNITSPLNGQSILTDPSGDITISGTVKDDGQISSVKMVHISTENIINVLDYFNAEYDGWETQKNGNKIFNFTLYGDDQPVDSVYTKTFGKTINIFDDLGISKDVRAGSQTLVFMAKDKSGASKIESYTLQGDIELPKISFDKITVKKSNGDVKEYSINGDEIPTLLAFSRNSNQEITDKIKFSGSWSDNSTTIWNDSSKIGDIKIILKNQSLTTKRNGYSWETEYVTPIDSTTGSVNAEITDWAGNLSKTSVSYYVSNSMPELVRISSLNYDGSYKVGDEILIALEYNKKVSFNDNGEPSLELNNGGKAIYDQSSNSNGTSKHIYKYVVSENDNEIGVGSSSKLGVSKIIATNCEWVDADNNKIQNPSLIPTGMNLSDIRSIVIDKTPPGIAKVEAITSDGEYASGKEIYFKLDFNEDVEILDTNGNIVNDLSEKVLLNLNVNDENGLTRSKVSASTMKTSSKTLFFTYTVEEGDFANPFGVTSLSCEGCTIVDKAKNPIGNTSIITCQTSFDGIVFDTKAPSVPVISGITDGQMVYDNEGVEFEINYGTDASVKTRKYSLDGGNSWLDYTQAIKLDNDGTYSVTAYQEDKAGNKSDQASTITIFIDRGKVLSSITTSLPDGTYSVDKVLPFRLNFRKNVRVTEDSKIQINIKNSQGQNCYATLQSGQSTYANTIIYEYTVRDGDYVENDQKVEVLAFHGNVFDERDNDVSDFCDIPETNNGALSDTCNMFINTINPYVESITFNGTDSLEIEFSNYIFKGNGNIELIQREYKAPVILSELQYAKYESIISDYYEEATNGADENYESYVDKKYVMKFGYDGNTTEVKDKLIEAGANKVVISVNSNKVRVDDKKLIVSLDDAYAIPVKGAYYDIEIPQGIVRDELNHNSVAKTLNEGIIVKAVEVPVIRINKKKESLQNGNVVQPYNVNVKIDCQTPGAQIYYSKVTNEIATHVWTKDNLGKYTGSNVVLNKPGTPATNYTGEFPILDSQNRGSGYKVYMNALGRKTIDGSVYNSELSYAAANRTVIVFECTEDFDNNYENRQIYNHRWIRGGNSMAEGGAITIPDFPISWNKEDNRYSKVRAMTKENGRWYWVTWNIDTIAYILFMAGDLPTTEEEFEKGPTKWIDSSCGIVTRKSETPVYGGESFTFENLTSIQQYGTLKYFEKHKDSR